MKLPQEALNTVALEKTTPTSVSQIAVLGNTIDSVEHGTAKIRTIETLEDRGKLTTRPHRIRNSPSADDSVRQRDTTRHLQSRHLQPPDNMIHPNLRKKLVLHVQSFEALLVTITPMYFWQGRSVNVNFLVARPCISTHGLTSRREACRTKSMSEVCRFSRVVNLNPYLLGSGNHEMVLAICTARNQRKIACLRLDHQAVSRMNLPFWSTQGHHCEYLLLALHILRRNWTTSKTSIVLMDCSNYQY